jgi:hypothetical protein
MQVRGQRERRQLDPVHTDGGFLHQCRTFLLRLSLLVPFYFIINLTRNTPLNPLQCTTALATLVLHSTDCTSSELNGMCTLISLCPR